MKYDHHEGKSVVIWGNKQGLNFVPIATVVSILNIRLQDLSLRSH